MTSFRASGAAASAHDARIGVVLQIQNKMIRRVWSTLIDRMAKEEAHTRGITRRAVSDDGIIARVTTALANEGARVLDEGYVTRAGDIDLIYCFHTGAVPQT